MTPGVEQTRSPGRITSPDKLYNTAKKPHTAANDSLLMSAKGQKRNMTGTRFMASTQGSKAISWFNSVGESTTAPGPKLIKPPTAPDNVNKLFGSYVGTFSKQYVPSFDGTFRSRSTATGTMMAPGTTRELNNQEGKDINYDSVTSYVHNPQPF